MWLFEKDFLTFSQNFSSVSVFGNYLMKFCFGWFFIYVVQLFRYKDTFLDYTNIFEQKWAYGINRIGLKIFCQNQERKLRKLMRIRLKVRVRSFIWSKWNRLGHCWNNMDNIYFSNEYFFVKAKNYKFLLNYKFLITFYVFFL